MNNEKHETVEDAARRDRLEQAMSTRAARWCAEQAATLMRHDEEAGRTVRPAGTAAEDLGLQYADTLVRNIYVQGFDPTSSWLVDSAWRSRALSAWGRLEYLTDEWFGQRPIDATYDRVIAELEAADAALTWQLESERIAR